MKQNDLPDFCRAQVISAPSFPTLLTVLFIGLKLGNVIDWSWIWVLSPIWIAWVAALAILCCLIQSS